MHGNLYPINLPRKIGGVRVPMHTFLVRPSCAWQPRSHPPSEEDWWDQGHHAHCLFSLIEIRPAVSGEGFCFLLVRIKGVMASRQTERPCKTFAFNVSNEKALATFTSYYLFGVVAFMYLNRTLTGQCDP